MSFLVLHISSICQKFQEIAQLLTILLEVKVDYPENSLQGSYMAPTFKEQCFYKVGSYATPVSCNQVEPRKEG